MFIPFSKFALFTTLFVIVLAMTANYIYIRIWDIPGMIEEPLRTYDYIIVGAGTAGCVVARRLLEKCDCSILLVEAGGPTSYAASIPLVAPALQMSSADWSFKTISQKNSHWGMSEQRSTWPRGKALGGSSAINYMVHMWGTRSDLDTYADITEDAAWRFDAVKKYFQKTETFLDGDGSGTRGSSGPLPVQQIKNVPLTLANAFVEGATSLGFVIGDLNGILENGIMLSQSNVKRGERVSSFDAYLTPILQKYNIHILAHTTAVRVLFNKKAAYGIEVRNTKTEKTYIVRCKREIVLSAGAIGSPHLLMLSGVGPAQQLEKVHIPVVENIPGLGQNLRDHLNLPMYFHLHAPLSLTIQKAKSISEMWKYFTRGQGYLSHNGVEVVARMPLSAGNSTKSEIYYLLLNVGSVDENLFKSIANFNDEEFFESFPESHNESKEGFVLLTACSHPKSKGNIVLTSSNPMIPPRIDPNYLADEDDVKCFLEAMRMGAQLGSTAPLRELGSQLHLPMFKPCAAYKASLDNDQYFECWLRTTAMTAYHPLGTCAMGKKNDSFAVLDSHFRVRNLRNLRVVDASALPSPPSGTPQATVLMMAEKAAELLLQDYN